MFRCCCSSSGGKTAIIAAVIGAAGMILGAKLADRPETAPAEEQAPTQERVIPAGYQPEMEMSPEDMMAAMVEWAAPVEEHEMLKHMAGSWDATAKFWMDPAAPPTEGKGVSESALILGGRYVTQHFSMPDFMGMEFEGYGAIGFDKAKGKYVNMWIDNFSTGMMSMEGEYDDDSQTMTWTGNAVYPGPEGVMEVPVKHIVRHDGHDKMVMEFWEPNPATGELVRTGEISYTRR